MSDLATEVQRVWVQSAEFLAVIEPTDRRRWDLVIEPTDRRRWDLVIVPSGTGGTLIRSGRWTGPIEGIVGRCEALVGRVRMVRMAMGAHGECVCEVQRFGDTRWAASVQVWNTLMSVGDPAKLAGVETAMRWAIENSGEWCREVEEHDDEWMGEMETVR